MSSRKVTPRGIIQGVLEVNSISKSVVNKSRTSRRRSLRKSLSSATPGTLIKGVLQTSSTAKKSPVREGRLVPTPRSSSRKSSRIARLQSSGSQHPTPRGLIRGYLTATVPETPATHVALSVTPDFQMEVDHENYQGKIADLISPDVDTPTLSQAARAETRRHQQISNEAQDAFRSGVHRRNQEKSMNLPSFSDSRVITPSLHSIPEEEAADPASSISESTDLDEAPRSQPVEEIAELAQLATQPQGPVRTDSSQDEEDSISDTSAISLSQVSLGEVAAANTIQVNHGVVSDESNQQDDESLEEDQPPASKPVEPVDSEMDGYSNESQDGGPVAKVQVSGNKSNLQDDNDSLEEDQPPAKKQKPDEEEPVDSEMVGGPVAEVQDRDVESNNKDGDGMLQTSQSMGDYLEQSSDSSEDDIMAEADEEEQQGDYSPLVTPNMLPTARRKTPAAKTPAVLRNQVNKPGPSHNRQRAPPKRSKPARRHRTLPLSLTKSIFTHFSNGRVSKDAWDAIEDCSDDFFERLCSDLARYSKHANRKTIKIDDIILLMKRQGQVTDMQSLYSLIEKYLSMEHRRELIPCAQVGGGAKPRKIS